MVEFWKILLSKYHLVLKNIQIKNKLFSAQFSGGHPRVPPPRGNVAKQAATTEI